MSDLHMDIEADALSVRGTPMLTQASVARALYAVADRLDAAGSRKASIEQFREVARAFDELPKGPDMPDLRARRGPLRRRRRALQPGVEIALDALRDACQPGKQWSERALLEVPQQIMLPLVEVALAARRVLTVLDTYIEPGFAECQELREALDGFV